jgi:glycosyltransferase involved in cell wall biosynthesis
MGVHEGSLACAANSRGEDGVHAGGVFRSSSAQSLDLASGSERANEKIFAGNNRVQGAVAGCRQTLMQESLSVILCTHNPRPEYFRRVLDALRAQTTPLERWEFLIIDNASDEQISDIWDFSWHPHARHVRENELGLTAARLRGIEESSGELLIFVDDDNLLAADFLEQAQEISVRYPYLGVFGAGILEPEFEVQPPPELLPYLHLLALRTVSSPLWSNNAQDPTCIPWGAGLCVARRVATSYRQLVQRLAANEVLDRRGQRLFCGGDDVFSWASVGAGEGFGLFPELRITHLILAGRLDKRYFVRLIHDHNFSNGVLRYLLTGIQQRRINFVRYVHLLLHRIKNGRFSMQCQWAASRGEDCAARFISENRLRPIQISKTRFANQILQEARFDQEGGPAIH